MHALTQTYDHSVVMPIWLVLTCEVPGKNWKNNIQFLGHFKGQTKINFDCYTNRHLHLCEQRSVNVCTLIKKLLRLYRLEVLELTNEIHNCFSDLWLKFFWRTGLLAPSHCYKYFCNQGQLQFFFSERNKTRLQRITKNKFAT